MSFECVSVSKYLFLKYGHFRPVTGGADHEEEQDVDCESVNDGYDGAFGDGNTRVLQLPYRDKWRNSYHQEVCVFSMSTRPIFTWFRTQWNMDWPPQNLDLKTTEAS